MLIGKWFIEPGHSHFHSVNISAGINCVDTVKGFGSVDGLSSGMCHSFMTKKQEVYKGKVFLPPVCPRASDGSKN